MIDLIFYSYLIVLFLVGVWAAIKIWKNDIPSQPLNPTGVVLAAVNPAFLPCIYIR